MTSETSAVERLAEKVGESWPAILASIDRSREQLAALRTIIRPLKPPPQTAVIAFGSLAREEWTSGSDVDWTLLIDGPSDMHHLKLLREIEDALQADSFKRPGRTGTFGSLSSSHELVHHIGGSEDSNQNITRRMLLVLESVSLADGATHERVVRAILERYITGDPPSKRFPNFHIPLFLLNDVVRFWRTMAVDYATKKWQRSNAGWAVRNLKLRMSRKLLFAKGMLVCFLCDEAFAGKPKATDPQQVDVELQDVCLELCCPAIQLLAQALHDFADHETARLVMGSYNEFLAAIDSEAQRKHLEQLPFGQSDEFFDRQRTLTKTFLEGLVRLFFSSNPRLTTLTQRYGVF